MKENKVQKHHWLSTWFLVVWSLLVFGCAGLGRSCSSCSAESFGADWVILQMDAFGHPYRCWELRDTSVDNEPQSDGIYWKEQDGNNLVHISGLYNRVQVVDGNWDRAFSELGISQETCTELRAVRYTINPEVDQ